MVEQANEKLNIHDLSSASDAVDSVMDGVLEDLLELSRIPSIAFEGHDVANLQSAHDMIIEWLRDVGVTTFHRLDLPGTPPVVFGEIPAPSGAPTVLLYSHYDVVPAGSDEDWHSPAFDPELRNGAVYGRGVADSKANVLAILGALRAFGGRPPLGVKIVIEGEEEVGGAFDTYPATRPDLFSCDAIVVADAGSVRPGVPTLTVGLRGDAVVTVRVHTLHAPKHSGQFGGAAPDALLVLMRALTSLHDDAGDVAVEGLRREPWVGTNYTEHEFRELAEVIDTTPLMGTGDLGSRLWSGPAITVIGLDAPSVEESMNAVRDSAAAKINLRIHPGQSAVEAQEALVKHLNAQMPFGVKLEVELGDTGDGYQPATEGRIHDLAVEALGAAWNAEVVHVGTGGSIPVAKALAEGAPNAELLLVGATDGLAEIHAPNERVMISELRACVLALVELMRRMAN